MDTATRITADHLHALGACDEWVYRFALAFPGGLAPGADPEAVATAYPFPLGWTLEVFEGVPGAEAAQAAYLGATSNAWATYEAATASAWAACREATAPAWAAYEETEAAARAAYREATAPAAHVARVAVVRAVLDHLAAGGEIGGAL